METLDYDALLEFGLALARYWDEEAGYEKKTSRYKVTPQAEREKRDRLALIHKIEEHYRSPSVPTPPKVYEILAEQYRQLNDMLTQNRITTKRKRV